MAFDLDTLVRENIRNLKPYSSARSEFTGSADLFLDANENSFGSPAGFTYNRYPDPMQSVLKARLSELEGIDPSKIFVGNGSDEAIDLLYRIFCKPGKDEAIICPPTYGMYRVSGDTNDVVIREVPLTQEFELDTQAVLEAISQTTKLIFICSPNNPTGNLMSRASIVEIANSFNGIVVVDEAYIHFANEPSMISEIGAHPNLVILKTFSKAWGMAGLRVGLAFSSEAIIELMNRVKPPYNVSGIAQQAVLDTLDRKSEIHGWIAETRVERERLSANLPQFEFVEKVFPSDSNFLFIKTRDADAVYEHLAADGIVVRNRNNVEFCRGCLRITIGTREENDRLIRSLQTFRHKI